MGEVYFGAGQIPATAAAVGGTESNGQQDGQDFDSILFLYAPRKGLQSIGDLQHCVNCEYIWLAGNQLERLHKCVSVCGGSVCVRAMLATCLPQAPVERRVQA